jgi:ABC-type sugar transport system ATPase subunit
VVLARAIEASPRALLVEEPTQGIDINAKAEIRRKLRTLADDGGCAVVIATSEFEELLGLADVIHVMRLGELVATLAGDTATYREILANALP